MGRSRNDNRVCVIMKCGLYDGNQCQKNIDCKDCGFIVDYVPMAMYKKTGWDVTEFCCPQCRLTKSVDSHYAFKFEQGDCENCDKKLS